MTTKSRYVGRAITPDKPCTLVSTNNGNCVMKRWSPEPNPPIPGVTTGADNNNMTTAFGLVDAYGIPITNTAFAPNFSGNVAGFQIPDISTYQVSYADAWLVLPAGVQTVSFGYRAYGNTSAGLYVGYAPKYAKRLLWNNVVIVPGMTVDASLFPELCGRKVLFARTYCCNGYFHGGHFVQWNVGAGPVDIPVANTFGAQPSQSKYP